jgi:hypothetical protein
LTSIPVPMRSSNVTVRLPTDMLAELAALYSELAKGMFLPETRPSHSSLPGDHVRPTARSRQTGRATRAPPHAM